MRSRPRAHLAIAFAVAANQLSVAAFAGPPLGQSMSLGRPGGSGGCEQSSGAGVCVPAPGDGLKVSLPDGGQPCPESGSAASCATNASSGSVPPGKAATPAGQTACAAAGSSLAACSEPAGTEAPAAASSQQTPSAQPSVPQSSLQPAAVVTKLTLATSSVAMPAGSAVLLTATAPQTVTGTGLGIAIFDQTTGTLVGACAQGIRCAVAFSAPTGVHSFAAYITAPTTHVPDDSVQSSNAVTVGWIGMTLRAISPAVGPGRSVTVTATSTVSVEKVGYALEIFDLTDMNLLTYCSQGTNCSVALSQAVSGARSLVAAVGKPTSQFSNPDIWAVSDHLALTWLSVNLSGGSTYQVGETVYLTATANADVSNTPWSIGIFDEQGHLVGAPCKTGHICRAAVTLSSSTTPHFTAAIGAVPKAQPQTKLGRLLQKVAGPSSLVDVQARSGAVQPSRVLWGVDSCKAFTGDPSGSEVYRTIAGTLGAPDFWGRYLTGTYYCPGLSWSEIYLAAKVHMGILPIFNAYDCSNVVGYDVGMAYAQEATTVAAHDGIPKGRVIAIDIEPPGAACPGAVDVNSWFIRGWYDGVHGAGYVPVFYGNGTSGSEFANAWCEAQSEVPAMSTQSYIWSFEPSLVTGGWSRSHSPVWQPYITGCPDYVAAWQYQIGSNGDNPDIDGDLALSILPLWYPS